MTPGERQELAHQIGGAVGVLLDLHDVGEILVAGLVVQQQQVGIADHGSQQIIEVMGNAPGQLTNRLHFLRLGELQFQLFLLGGIDDVNDQIVADALAGAPNKQLGRALARGR